MSHHYFPSRPIPEENTEEYFKLIAMIEFMERRVMIRNARSVVIAFEGE